MAELYLVRHGQASFGAENYDQLSPLGKQQASWLGQYFGERDIRFDQVIIGTQLRHRQTADGICGAMAQTLDYSEHPGLNEYDFYALFNALGTEHAELKRLAGGNKRDFYKGLKEVLQLWSTDKLDGDLPESWAEFAERVGAARQYIQQSGGQRILVVSSGGPIGMMTRQVLDASANTAIELNFQIRNASFTHFYLNQRTVRLASFNNIPHLDQAGRLNAISYG